MPFAPHNRTQKRALEDEGQFVGTDADGKSDGRVVRQILADVAKERNTSVSEAQSDFDAMMLVYKRGHLLNVATLDRHPTMKEKMDKYVLISSHGVTLPQVWHVDASLNITSSFCLLTRSLPTKVFSSVRPYSRTQALLMAGIGEEFHAGRNGVIAYCKSKETGKVATNTLVILDDICALLPPYWTTYVDSSHNVSAPPGTIVSTHGAWPHCAPGSDGPFRCAMLITSMPDHILQPGYNKEVQHHRSQVCLYLWSFAMALYWLYMDRVESHDADSHWVTSPKTQKVVMDFLSAAHAWPTWDAARLHAPLWERSLAAAFKHDGYKNAEAWKAWVPREMRVPLTAAERKTLASQVAAGKIAKAA